MKCRRLPWMFQSILVYSSFDLIRLHALGQLCNCYLVLPNGVELSPCTDTWCRTAPLYWHLVYNCLVLTHCVELSYTDKWCTTILYLHGVKLSCTRTAPLYWHMVYNCLVLTHCVELSYTEKWCTTILYLHGVKLSCTRTALLYWHMVYNCLVLTQCVELSYTDTWCTTVLYFHINMVYNSLVLTHYTWCRNVLCGCVYVGQGMVWGGCVSWNSYRLVIFYLW